jgi:hypothetical protein
MPQIIWGGQSGCLLPLLIILNLLFGRVIFNSTLLWLGVEGLLIFIFIIKVRMFMRRISQRFNSTGSGPDTASRLRRKEAIDVEAKVVE